MLAKAGGGAAPFFAGAKAQVPLKEPKPQYWYDLQSLEAAQADAQSICSSFSEGGKRGERESRKGELSRAELAFVGR